MLCDCLRDREGNPYSAQRLTFSLRPDASHLTQGANIIEVAMGPRPPTMKDIDVALTEVKLSLDYGDRFAARL